MHYRTKYTIYPLPIVAFLPYLLHHLSDAPATYSQHLTFDIRPEHELIVIRPKNSSIVDKIVPLMPTEVLEKIKEESFLFAPEVYTNDEYQNRIQLAMKKGHQSYLQKHSVNRRKRVKTRCKISKHRRKPTFYEKAHRFIE